MIHLKPPKWEDKSQRPGDTDGVVNIGRHCATCHRDISEEVYIKCVKCHGFNQCIECFAAGYEAQMHLRTHPYMIIDPVQPPIYSKNWTSEEEVLLLSAMQKAGFGNWQETASLLKTKTPTECEAHYFETYFNSEQEPYPENKIKDPAFVPPPPDFPTEPTESLPSIATVAERNKKERTTPGEFAGWMPNRDEFELDYQNDAELGMIGISFSPTEDTEETLKDKLNSLRQYNETVEERHKRTMFAKEYNLIDSEFKGFGPQTRENHQIEESLLPLAQILSKEELTEFILAIENETRLKNSLEKLRKWWANGIATHDEGEMFDMLEELSKEDKLTPSQIERWNRIATQKAESPEFRAALDRQLLTPSENAICTNLNIGPHIFVRIEDVLLREFAFSGKMDEETAISFSPGQARVMRVIYRHMASLGKFCDNPCSSIAGVTGEFDDDDLHQSDDNEIEGENDDNDQDALKSAEIEAESKDRDGTATDVQAEDVESGSERPVEDQNTESANEGNINEQSAEIEGTTAEGDQEEEE